MWPKYWLMDKAGDADGGAGAGDGGGDAGASGDKGGAGDGAGKSSGAASGAAGGSAGSGAGSGSAGAGDGGKGAGAGGAGAANGDAKKVTWPEDWQRRMAGEDEKELKQVARYASPEEVWKKARALERRLTSGELKPTLPKNPKPDELAAWRKDNDIPEKPEGYDLKGVEFPEADKPIVDEFLKSAHGAHFTPEQTRTALRSYYAIEKANQARRAEMDEEQRTAALDALNQEFGGQFRRNLNLIGGVLSKFPDKVREAIKSARMPDGTAMFNNLDVVKGFLSLALEINPAGIVVPAGGGDLGKSMVDRFKEIQKVMRDDRGAYNKDKSMQREMQDLIDGLTKHGLIDKNGNLTERKAA